MNDEIMQSMFYQAEDFFFRKIGRKVFEFDGIANAYLTGVNSAGLNLLVLKDYSADFNYIFNLGFKISINIKYPGAWLSRKNIAQKK